MDKTASRNAIAQAETVLGIELGSTRIKGVWLFSNILPYLQILTA